MTEPNVEQSMNLQSKAEKHKFKTLRELDLDEPEQKSSYIKPTQDQINSWVNLRHGAIKDVTLKIKIGFPEVCDLPLCFLAVAYFKDHVEVLNKDGKTHKFLLSEISL